MPCPDALGCVEVAVGEPVTIAAMMVQSGPAGFLGLDQIGAIEIAIEEYGDLLGHDIDLVAEDSLCNAEGGQTAAQKVVANPSVVGVLGTACSRSSATALPIIHGAGLSMISGSSTSPALTDPDRDNGGVWQPGYYRTATNDLFQGRLAGEYAYRHLGARSVATIHDGSAYAERLQEVMAETMVGLGGRITYQGTVNVGDTEMLPMLVEIAADPPDILFYPLLPPEVNFITEQARGLPELEDTVLMSADAAYASDIVADTGEAILGLYLTAPLVEGERYEKLLATWATKFGGSPPSAFHAQAYDAAMILLQAIASVARDDGLGNLLIGKQAVRDALNAVEDFPGITGTLACSETGDCATGEALGVYRINDMHAWPPEIVYPE